MTGLIALYDFSYGPKGRMDAEAPIIRRGEEFQPVPTVQASALEAGKHLIANGVAVTPETWAKRKPTSDSNWTWAQEQVAAGNRKRGRA